MTTSEDTVVECKSLEVGDVVRRPVPGAEWLTVIHKEDAERRLVVRSHENGDVFEMRWTPAAKWMVRRGDR